MLYLSCLLSHMLLFYNLKLIKLLSCLSYPSLSFLDLYFLFFLV